MEWSNIRRARSFLAARSYLTVSPLKSLRRQPREVRSSSSFPFSTLAVHMRHTLTDGTQVTQLTSIVNPPCSVTSGRVVRRCCRTSGYRIHRAYFVPCTSWPTATSGESRPPHAERKDKSTPARGRAPTPPTSPAMLRPSNHSFVSGSDSTSRGGCSTNISVDRKQGLLRVRRPVVLNNLECRPTKCRTHVDRVFANHLLHPEPFGFTPAYLRTLLPCMRSTLSWPSPQ